MAESVENILLAGAPEGFNGTLGDLARSFEDSTIFIPIQGPKEVIPVDGIPPGQRLAAVFRHKCSTRVIKDFSTLSDGEIIKVAKDPYEKDVVVGFDEEGNITFNNQKAIVKYLFQNNMSAILIERPLFAFDEGFNYNEADEEADNEANGEEEGEAEDSGEEEGEAEKEK